MHLPCRYWHFHPWIKCNYHKMNDNRLSNEKWVFSCPVSQQNKVCIMFPAEYLEHSPLDMSFTSALPCQSSGDHISCMHMITNALARALPTANMSRSGLIPHASSNVAFESPSISFSHNSRQGVVWPGPHPLYYTALLISPNMAVYCIVSFPKFWTIPPHWLPNGL